MSTEDPDQEEQLEPGDGEPAAAADLAATSEPGGSEREGEMIERMSDKERTR